MYRNATIVHHPLQTSRALPAIDCRWAKAVFGKREVTYTSPTCIENKAMDMTIAKKDSSRKSA